MKEEKMTRFCPGCGSVGPVEGKFRDCCPDGSDARAIPEKLANQCRDLFKLAISEAAQTPLTDKQISLVLDEARVYEIEDVPPEYDRLVARAVERWHGIK